eukprot:1652840-Rhodomonas_salina.1
MMTSSTCTWRDFSAPKPCSSSCSPSARQPSPHTLSSTHNMPACPPPCMPHARQTQRRAHCKTRGSEGRADLDAGLALLVALELDADADLLVSGIPDKPLRRVHALHSLPSPHARQRTEHTHTLTLRWEQTCTPALALSTQA